MAHSRFDKYVRIEQIRYMENSKAFVPDADASDHGSHDHLDFDGRLWRRAQQLTGRHALANVLGRAARLTAYARSAAMIVAIALGGTGALVAVSESQTINVYWLLLVLIGFNFAAMMLWLIGISSGIDRMASGVLARLADRVPVLIDRYARNVSSVSALADRAWLACNFSGRVGKWHFGKITHQLWLAYLSGGLVLLVLLLMVRQYDFAWGTTLLSDAFFARVTEWLAAPLHALGFETPTAEQVLDTRIGEGYVASSEHRHRWARFLLGAMLLYGILPRLMLWIWSAAMLAAARRNYTLDYYLPYYISLRQQLMPLAGHGEVVDADDSGPDVTETRMTEPAHHAIPGDALWAGVELGDDTVWPPPFVESASNLGRVVDRESLVLTLRRLEGSPGAAVAVAVAAARAPDRGLQRTIDSLLSRGSERWLVLLQTGATVTLSPGRLAAWYRLAETCRVPADHVVSVSTG